MAEPAAVLRPLVISELSPALNITLVQDGAGLDKLAKCVTRLISDSTPTLGLDTETNVVPDFYWRRVRTVQIGDKNEQFVIDLLAFAGSENALIESQGHYGSRNKSVYKPIFDILNPVLCSNTFLKVGQNLAFEYEVFNWNFGQRIWNLFSIDLAERAIKAGVMSLKNYPYFSLEQQVARYFGMQIDKSKQKTFDLSSPLTQDQIEYGALDIRMPLAVRQAQMRILERDRLLATVQIENDALCSYTDMHITGQRLNSERWLTRVAKIEAKRVDDIKELDTYFIPVVGHKNDAINEVELNRLENIWKTGFEVASQEEMSFAAAARTEKDPLRKAQLKAQCKASSEHRRDMKAAARANYMVLSKARTKAKRIIEKCEGEAFINYNSGDQLLAAFARMRGLGKLKSTTDDDLLIYNDRPMIQCLRRYKKGKKGTGTYGAQWTQTWTTKPCTEEGWLHPGDGRLHCTFNQLETETGRSSSSKPNAQNLPGDDDIRACFICDPPNADIRISVCCEEEAQNREVEGVYHVVCPKCGQTCETKPEEYCIVTVDMSGAELRIIADLANAKSWIDAFNKGWDVHSVGTEILYPTEWPACTLRSKLTPDWWTVDSKEIVLTIIKDGKEKKIGPCMYFARTADGEFARLKCDCPEHYKLRNGNKSTNFLLCYGGGPSALADALGISLDDAKDLYRLHESKFPDIWGYLKRSGKEAMVKREARDMFGRRRLFPEPTWEDAKIWFMDEHEDRLELDIDQQEANIFHFKAQQLREPNEIEMWGLTHRKPTTKEISSSYKGMFASIERRGKNMPIQGTNASIAKRAMGCGFDKDSKGYLWHLLPQYKARLQNFVHDELVAQCPKRYGKIVKRLIGDAFTRAGAEVLKHVTMEWDGHVAERWLK